MRHVVVGPIDDVNPPSVVDQPTESGGDRRHLCGLRTRRVKEIARDQQKLAISSFDFLEGSQDAFPKRRAHGRVTGPRPDMRVGEVGEDEVARIHAPFYEVFRVGLAALLAIGVPPIDSPAFFAIAAKTPAPAPAPKIASQRRSSGTPAPAGAGGDLGGVFRAATGAGPEVVDEMTIARRDSEIRIMPSISAKSSVASSMVICRPRSR